MWNSPLVFFQTRKKRVPLPWSCREPSETVQAKGCRISYIFGLLVPWISGSPWAFSRLTDQSDRWINARSLGSAKLTAILPRRSSGKISRAASQTDPRRTGCFSVTPTPESAAPSSIRSSKAVAVMGVEPYSYLHDVLTRLPSNLSHMGFATHWEKLSGSGRTGPGATSDNAHSMTKGSANNGMIYIGIPSITLINDVVGVIELSWKPACLKSNLYSSSVRSMPPRTTIISISICLVTEGPFPVSQRRFNGPVNSTV